MPEHTSTEHNDVPGVETYPKPKVWKAKISIPVLPSTSDDGVAPDGVKPVGVVRHLNIGQNFSPFVYEWIDGSYAASEWKHGVYTPPELHCVCVVLGIHEFEDCIDAMGENV